MFYPLHYTMMCGDTCETRVRGPNNSPVVPALCSDLIRFMGFLSRFSSVQKIPGRDLRDEQPNHFTAQTAGCFPVNCCISTHSAVLTFTSLYWPPPPRTPSSPVVIIHSRLKLHYGVGWNVSRSHAHSHCTPPSLRNCLSVCAWVFSLIHF